MVAIVGILVWIILVVMITLTQLQKSQDQAEKYQVQKCKATPREGAQFCHQCGKKVN